MFDCVAGLPISGHVELATLPDIGIPAPCQTRPEAPSLRAGIFSQALSENRRFERSIQGSIGSVPKQSRIAQRRDKRNIECEVQQA